MKKILSAIILFTSINLNSQNELIEHVKYSSSGGLEEKGQYLNGKKSGEWKYYFADYKVNLVPTEWLDRLENYENGKLEGKQIQYYDGGPIISSITEYKNGVRVKYTEYQVSYKWKDKSYIDYSYSYAESGEEAGRDKNGIYESYYDVDEGGKLKETGSFLNDKKSGLWKTYYNSGNIMTEENYLEGELVGISKEFYETGEVSAIGDYKAGLYDAIQYNTYYKNGELKTGRKKIQEDSDFYYSYDNFEYVSFYENGKLAYNKDLVKIDMIDFQGEKKKIEVFKHSSFYEDGQLKSEYFTRNGNEVWKYVEYFEDGQLKEKRYSMPGKYSKYELSGEYIKYYPNGNIEIKGNYSYGLKIGLWETYFEDGRIMERKYCDEPCYD